MVRSYKGLKDDKNDLESIKENKLSIQETYSSEVIENWREICEKQKDGISTDVLEANLLDISGKNDNIIRFIMTALIILGLLGTFVGMTISLYSISDIISQIRDSSSTSEASAQTNAGEGQPSTEKKQESTEIKFERLMDNLKPVLKGMRLAFFTSVLGLMFSMALGIAFTAYSKSRATFRMDAMAFANQVLIPQFSPSAGRNVQESLGVLVNTVDSIKTTVEEGLSQLVNISSRELQISSIDSNNLSDLKTKTIEQNELLDKVRVRIGVIRDHTENMVGKLDESIKKNSVDQLVIAINDQNTKLINEVTKATNEAIDKTLSKMQKDLETSYKQMVDYREKIDSKLTGFIDAAKVTAESVSEQNRKLTEKMQKQLTEKLGEINNTLNSSSIKNNETLNSNFGKIDKTLENSFDGFKSNLSKNLDKINDSLEGKLTILIDRIGRFDAPVQTAADKIEGTQANFARFVERVVRDMESIYNKQIERNEQQLDTLGKANDRIATFLDSLNKSSKLQSANTETLTVNFNNLNDNLTNLTSNMGSLSTRSNSLDISISNMSKEIQTLESSLKNFTGKFQAVSLDLSGLNSLNQSVNTVAKCTQSLESSIKKFNEEIGKLKVGESEGRRKFTLFRKEKKED